MRLLRGNNKNMKNDLIRHGENLFLRVKALPKEAKLVEEGNNLIVAHSESGHNHTLTIPNVKEAVIKIFEFEGQTYLDVPLEAKLQHQKKYEKHADLQMKPGIWKKITQRNFSYAEGVSKKVID